MPQSSLYAPDPTYLASLLQAPSPSDSFDMINEEDDTAGSDEELNDHDFARKCDEAIGLVGDVLEPEDYALGANQGVLLMRPRGQEEEKILFNTVMLNLRERVAEMEEEEFFETAVIRTSPIADEPDPDDIDSIMQSLLGPSSTPQVLNADQSHINGFDTSILGIRSKEKVLNNSHEREDSGATAVPSRSLVANSSLR